MNFSSLFQNSEYITSQTIIFSACIAIGWLSFILTQIIAVSQLLQVYKTRNTSGLSVWTYVIFAIGSFISIAWAVCYYLKMIYGTGGPQGSCIDLFNTHEREILLPLAQWGIIPLIAYNLADIGVGFILFITKFKHIALAKKMKISELQLSKVMLDKKRKEFIASGKKISKSKYFDIALIIPIVYVVVAVVCFLIYKFAVPIDQAHAINLGTAQNPVFFWDSGLMIISVISAFGWEAVSWPTFIGTLRKRDTTGISINWAIFLPVSMTIQFFYALTLAMSELAVGGIDVFPPDTIGSLIFNGLIVNYGVLIIKIKNRKMAKKLHMTEMQYTERILVPEYERKVAARVEVQRQIEVQQAKVVAERDKLSKMKTDSKKTEKKIYKDATKEYKKRLARNKKRRQKYAASKK